MHATLRPFRDSDVDAVVEFSLRAFAPIHASFQRVLGDEVNFRVYPDWRASQEAGIRNLCTSDAARVWVADIDGRLVGFVAVVIDAAAASGEIDMLAVDPDHQRRGIGEALTELALGHLRDSGCTLAVVATGGDPGHAAARRTYERAGFTPLPLVRYYKNLNGPD